MKKPPTRPNPAPTPSGLHDRPPEPPMHPNTHRIPRQPLSLLQALALSVATTGCFNPLVTLETDGGTDDDPTDASTTDELTTLEPDSGSGDGLTPVCGNGVVEDDELCDDGVNDGSYGGCNADCTAPGPFCGDGVVNGEEPCDDGDDVDGNGCNVDCVVSGSVLWTVTYDGPDHGSDYAGGVAVDVEDNIVIAGSVHSDGNSVAWVRKYTPQGAAVWTQFFPSRVDNSTASPIVTLDNSEVVLGGNMDPADDTNPDAWVRGLSSVGNTTWMETYASPQGGSDRVIDLERDGEENIYTLIEESPAPTTTGVRTLLRKYTQNGAELWTTTIENVTTVHDFTVEPDGSSTTVGNAGEQGSFVPHLAHRSGDGPEVWSETYPEYPNAYFNAIDIDTNGRMLVSLVSADSNERILVLDESGIVTEEIFPHAQETTIWISTILSLDDGHFVAAGIKGADGHLWTSRFSNEGIELWTHTYNGDDWGLGLDAISSLAVDSLGNIVATGSIQDMEATGQDIWLTRFAP